MEEGREGGREGGRERVGEREGKMKRQTWTGKAIGESREQRCSRDGLEGGRELQNEGRCAEREKEHSDNDIDADRHTNKKKKTGR